MTIPEHHAVQQVIIEVILLPVVVLLVAVSGLFKDAHVLGAIAVVRDGVHLVVVLIDVVSQLRLLIGVQLSDAGRIPRPVVHVRRVVVAIATATATTASGDDQRHQ